MATPNPIQQLADDIHEVQSKISDLQEGVRLTDARDAIGDLQTTVNGLAQRIAGLRPRGYVFEKDLEGQASTLVQQWTVLYPTLTAQVNSQASSLEMVFRPLQVQSSQLSGQENNPAVRPQVAGLQAAASALEGNVEAAERSIEGMYSQFNTQVNALANHLNEIDWMLNQIAEASFKLLPTEAGIAAVKAVWCKSGKEQKDDPEGVLYLTDQRLLFEQKEEVATKKVLFVATEKKTVQGLQMEVPASQVDTVTTSKQGLLKNEDHIEIRFLPGAPVELAHFHIWRENTAWQALINRAKAKDFDAGRAVPIDQAAVDKVKAAPSQCPNCGGNINQVILRGQDSLKCEYCGFVIRL